MKKPFRLLVKRDELSVEGIQQFYVEVGKDRGGRKELRLVELNDSKGEIVDDLDP